MKKRIFIILAIFSCITIDSHPQPASILEKKFPASFRMTQIVTLKNNTLDLSKTIEPRFLVGLALPESKEYQEISDLRVSAGEIVEYEGRKGKYVRYVGKEPLKKLTFTYRITTCKLFPQWDRIEKIYPYNTSSPDYIRYTKRDDGRIQADNPIIRKAAHAIRKESKDLLDYVKKAYTWEQKTLKWKPSGGSIDEIFANGGGECSSLSTVFISLLRNNGIPGRWMIGYIIRNGKGESHFWPEFYLEGYGWLPADPAFFGGPADDPYYFGYHDGRRMFHQRGDDYFIKSPDGSPVNCGGGICYWSYWKGGTITGSWSYEIDVSYNVIDDGNNNEVEYYDNPSFVTDVQKKALAMINDKRKSKGLSEFPFSERLNVISCAYLNSESVKDPLKESGIKHNYWGRWSISNSFPTLTPAEKISSDFPWTELEKPQFNQLGIGYRYDKGLHQFYFVLIQALEHVN